MSTELKNLSQTGELPSGEGKNFIIVVSEWNDGITSALLEGAMDTLKKAGAPEQNIRTLKVPGCFELPYAAQEAALSYKPHAVICLGCVIKGETPHFDYVCQAATQGILQGYRQLTLQI